MISEENVKMGNKALADDELGQSTASRSRSLNLGSLSDSLNFRRFGDGALAVRDKIQDNPKVAAGIALAIAGGVWAISRSMSASRRRQTLITRLLAGAGLWRALSPMLRRARKQAPKLGEAGVKRAGRTVELLRKNAGPLLSALIPMAVNARRRRFGL